VVLYAKALAVPGYRRLLSDIEAAAACCCSQVTHNRSLDGVLDQLNSKALTDAGPLQLIDHDDAGEGLGGGGGVHTLLDRCTQGA
jgi:hypothetical protein